ncbi:hypothetical protein LTS10_003775 [Elasticomyces elasticus]|nr:hypothetical protein LTS10_003775 [Elasticomyces elasticus]
MSKPIKRSRHRKAGPVVEQGEAAAAVLGLPELLESILLEIDTKTLLLSQRVDKTFHNVIGGSQQLQFRLGFRRPSSIQPNSSAGELNDPMVAPLLLGEAINMGCYRFQIREGRYLS